MFGRRKQSDGFEWHKYVRTTVRLRREERRQRILDARRAAAEHAGAAGVAGAQGSRAAGAAAVDGARAGLGAAWLVAQAAVHLAWHVIVTASIAAGRGIAATARPVIALPSPGRILAGRSHWPAPLHWAPASAAIAAAASTPEQALQ